MREHVRVKGRMTFRYLDADGQVVAERTYRNLITQGMDNLLAAYLAGLGTGLGSIYCAVGTGVTAPNYNDNRLATELGRAILAQNGYAGNIVLFSFTFPPAAVVGTLTEAGVFVNASATINTGSLINHVLITEDKTNQMTLIIEAQFTIQ